MSNTVYNNTTTPVASSILAIPTEVPELSKVLEEKTDGSRTVIMGKNTDPRALFHALYHDNSNVAGGDAHLMAYLQTHGGYPNAGDVFTVPPTQQYIGKQNHAVTQMAARIISHLDEQNNAPNHRHETAANRKWDKADEAAARHALDVASSSGRLAPKVMPQRLAHEDTVVGVSPLIALRAPPATTQAALTQPRSRTGAMGMQIRSSTVSAKAVTRESMSSAMRDFKVGGVSLRLI